MEKRSLFMFEKLRFYKNRKKEIASLVYYQNIKKQPCETRVIDLRYHRKRFV